jgi:hypothetical protein
MALSSVARTFLWTGLDGGGMDDLARNATGTHLFTKKLSIINLGNSKVPGGINKQLSHE